MTNIEIARLVKLKPITEIAAEAGIPSDAVEQYGAWKAKIDAAKLTGEEGKLVLVTAITPTSAGEGKTTTTIGLADGLRHIGKKACVALREPSLGPVFGVKGGAAGGGQAQVLPMEDINLHFTGDFHAITMANNLLAALIDNHIQQGNALNIDPCKLTWRRCMDMNDRQLRNIVSGLGGRANGRPREDGFDITAASEVMATLCMAEDFGDLKKRLERLVIGYTYEDEPVTAGDLRAAGAMCALLKDAIKPNLVQTIGGTPALVHGGPFANIAHGCNTVIATRAAMKIGEFAITEAGFGADLGAEKFFDIKCRAAGLKPAAVVVVATVRALMMHGGAVKNKPYDEVKCLKKGVANLTRHVRNMTEVFGMGCVVAINKFAADADEHIAIITDECRKIGVNVTLSTVWADGGKGGKELAREVVRLCEQGNALRFAYDLDSPIRDKLAALATRVYGGSGIALTPEARRQEKRLTELGFGRLPVCVAKTQYSFSDNPKLLNAPTGFTITVRSMKVSAGAGFIVALTGDIMTMPGLPKIPAAEAIDIDENGNIEGLF